MGTDLSPSERVRERERQRERDGEGERSRRSLETTNANRSLNCKHNLKGDGGSWDRAVASADRQEFAMDQNKMFVLTGRDVTAQQGGDGAV